MELTLFSKVGLEREEKMSNSRAAVITCSEAVWLKLVILFVEVFGGVLYIFNIFFIFLYIFISILYLKNNRENQGAFAWLCVLFMYVRIELYNKIILAAKA